jgi:pimeloyl-ACP methyl ester carboxylesterase
MVTSTQSEGPRPLLLLHGALGARDQLAPLEACLAGRLGPAVHVLEFEGHGSSPELEDAPYRIERCACEIVDFLDAEQIPQADIFGYSMGGYAALYLAGLDSGADRIGRILTLGTKLEWSPEIAAREIRMLDADKIEAKVPKFAAMLAERHSASGWRTVMEKTAGLLTALGEQPLLDLDGLARLPHPVRLCLGDRDEMVGLDETQRAFKALPDGEFCVLPRTPHPMERVRPERLADVVVDYLTKDSNSSLPSR